MKAWVLVRHGKPDRAFALREMPDPVPAPDQVLIRCEGFGLNFADVMARKGLYRDAPPIPCVLGYEVVGSVERCGDKVPADLRGRRVIALTRFGGYAQAVCADRRAIAPIPDDMEIGAALALATQGCTAWHATHFSTALRAGQRVLVHGAAGGVGHLIVQIALRKGCEVFAVASGEAKRSFLRSLGAQHPIDRDLGDHARQVAAIPGASPVDVSFNAVGGSSFKKDLRLLGKGGSMVLYGGAERSAGRLGRLSTLKFIWDMGLVLPIFLMMRSQGLIGLNMLRVAERDPDLLMRCMKEVAEAAGQGWLKPHVHAVLPAGRLAEAHALLESGRTIGKLALRW